MTENATEKQLREVDPGMGRWWKVELERKVQTKPIKVTLMENIDAVKGRKGFSTELGFERTIAQPASIVEAAKTVIERVSRYREVVGEYGTEGMS